MITEDELRTLVAAQDYRRQQYREQWTAHTRDRTIDVCAVIGEPFSYSDVRESVMRVVLADGMPEPEMASFASVTRQTMRDLEDAQQITRVRAATGSRPHLFVRTHQARYPPRPRTRP